MNQVAAAIPAAAGTPAARLLREQVRTGRVLAVFSSALVVTVPSPTGERQLSLLTRTAAGVPNGVRLPAGFDGARLRMFSPGEPADIGHGRIELGTLRIRLVREWTTRVRSGAVSPVALSSLAAAIRGQQPGVDSGLVAALGAALDDDDAAALADAVFGLVGVGSGLTPGGDDVLAGVTVGLLVAGRGDLIGQVAAAVPWAHTNAVSAELLRLALCGHASTEILAVLRRLMGAWPTPIPTAATATAISRLLAVGHTSGADLATGLLLGLAQRPRSDDGA